MNKLEQANMADKILLNFYSHINELFPDLKLNCAGSIRFNSFEIGMDPKVAIEILTPEEFKMFEKHGILRR